MNTHFATSQRNDMRPLAFEGILVTDCYAQLREFIVQNDAFLKQHGIADASAFLAEPMYDAASGQIDWYAAAQGTPLPIASLPPNEQAAVRAMADKYLAALRALAERKEGENGMASSLLALALRHPSVQDIYVLGSAPVLINWGFEASTQADDESIMRFGDNERLKAAPAAAPCAAPNEASASVPPAAPVPPVQPQIVTARTTVAWTGCLSWLLPFLLLLLLLWLLLAMLGVLPSPIPASFLHQDVSTEQELARSRGLQDQAIDVYAKLQTRHLQCLPKEPIAEVPAEKPAEEPQLPTENLNEAPAEEQTPEPEEKEAPVAEPADPPAVQDPPKEEPKPLAQNDLPDFGSPAVTPEESAPKPAFTPPPKGSAMQIPEEAAKNNDLSFLEGCWRSSSILHNTYGEVVTAEYCFQSNGKGRRRIKGKRDTCSGSARAKFSGSTLVISAGEAPCKNGARYASQKVQCKKRGSSTQCSGRDFMGGQSSTRWSATFIRK